MEKKTFNLWKTCSDSWTENPTITAYIPKNKVSDCAVVILPGGAYCGRAPHEGEGYARFFYENGICSFVCDYRVSPSRFPIELADSRRAIQFVRFHAKEYGLDKNKIAIMGSSAGGNLAALTSTYFEEIERADKDEIDKEDFIPNAQILCYPVIKLSMDEKVAHVGSAVNLLGMDQLHLARRLSPEYNVSDRTPECFMWHTLADNAVPVANSLQYAQALRDKGISCELHIFPDGAHGLGLADGGDEVSNHVSQWSGLLLKWLAYVGFVK